ncbi:MAG: sigma-70 family RNA polymerase sigma factor [Prolixibacteraceae bacterium]|nr:sigma-70 family RNA polymerase sigma factor [Prolixibacteraceae bacterium]MBN2774201.1 sigma-70 family RNA polymerase sigma factor [Prolixibacteraceae bacterium]
MNSDYKIWEAFKDGDKSALSSIYFKHFHSMFQYGIRIKEDPDFVKDCIHDVFLKLIKAGKRLNSTDNIRFYLFKALKNTIYKRLEKEKKVQLTIDLNFKTSFVLEEKVLSQEKLTEHEKALADALSHLSSRQREIIYLRYECEMDYSQICDIMKIKNDSARKLVFRAIKTLRRVIKVQKDTSLLLFLGIF